MMRHFVVAILIFVSTTNIYALSSDGETLRDIREMHVVLESLDKEIRGSGLRMDDIRTDVELKLRLAGLQLSDSSENYLYVNVNAIKYSEDMYVYSVSADFNQAATLKQCRDELLEEAKGIQGDPQTATRIMLDYEIFCKRQVVTWGRSMIGTAPTRLDPPRIIRASVRDLVDQFINEHLAAKHEKVKRLKEMEETKTEGAKAKSAPE